MPMEGDSCPYPPRYNLRGYIMSSCFNDLAISIIEKAVNDYRLLKELCAETIVVDDGDKISIGELEEFFHSEWCNYLLCNMKLTGEDILYYLNRE
jgi:hypothetical protein